MLIDQRTIHCCILIRHRCCSGRFCWQYILMDNFHSRTCLHPWISLQHSHYYYMFYHSYGTHQLGILHYNFVFQLSNKSQLDIHHQQYILRFQPTKMNHSYKLYMCMCLYSWNMDLNSLGKLPQKDTFGLGIKQNRILHIELYHWDTKHTNNHSHMLDIMKGKQHTRRVIH